MKNQVAKKGVIYVGIIVCVVLSLVAILLPFILNGRQLTANEIYNAGMDNVVELKAESESVGNSFGTAELFDDHGTLVTNAHVVTYKNAGITNKFEQYFIRFMRETEYREVELVKYDLEKDIAVLKLIKPSDLKLVPVKAGKSSAVKAGDKVYALGNAANYGIGIFGGMISNPLVNIDADGVVKSVIQSDITISSGNSGGALFNRHGELIGITTFRTKDLSGNVVYGIVYSIPIDIVAEYIKQQ